MCRDMLRIIICLLLISGAYSKLDDENLESLIKPDKVQNTDPIEGADSSKTDIPNEKNSIDVDSAPPVPKTKTFNLPPQLNKEQIDMLAEKVLRIHGVKPGSSDEENQKNIDDLRKVVASVERNLNEKLILTQAKKKNEAAEESKKSVPNLVETSKENEIPNEQISPNTVDEINSSESQISNENKQNDAEHRETANADDDDVAEVKNNESKETEIEIESDTTETIDQKDIEDENINESEQEGIRVNEEIEVEPSTGATIEKRDTEEEDVNGTVDSNTEPQDLSEDQLEATLEGSEHIIDENEQSINLEESTENSSKNDGIPETNTNEDVEVEETNPELDSNDQQDLTDDQQEAPVEISESVIDESKNINVKEISTDSVFDENEPSITVAENNGISNKTDDISETNTNEEEEEEEEAEEEVEEEATNTETVSNDNDETEENTINREQVDTEAVENESDNAEVTENDDISGSCSLNGDCEQTDDKTLHAYKEEYNAPIIKEEELENEIEDTHLQRVIKFFSSFFN